MNAPSLRDCPVYAELRALLDSRVHPGDRLLVDLAITKLAFEFHALMSRSEPAANEEVPTNQASSV